jgi:hypothetical protein
MISKIRCPKNNNVFFIWANSSVLTCADFGAVQECESSTEGACQIGCEDARCDGGKCDQRLATTCTCTGGKYIKTESKNLKY